MTGSDDQTVHVWDAQIGRSLAELKGHTDRVESVSVTADGSLIVTGSADETVRVWDARTGHSLTGLKGDIGEALCVVVTADGSRVVTGSRDGTARVWDARNGQALAVLRGQAEWATWVTLSADGSRVVTQALDGTARVWDVKTGQILLEITEHMNWGTAVAVSADGSRVFAENNSGGRRRVGVWDVATGKRLDGEPVPPITENDHRTPDGKYTFCANGNHVLKVPILLDEGERASRHWLTRPAPDWHAQRHKELQAEGNAYGVALHQASEARARGIVALEDGRLDEAWAHFLVAAALTPPAPKVLDLAPPPREFFARIPSADP